jgi:cytochrome bd-type quinol oxidase subunit 1
MGLYTILAILFLFLVYHVIAHGPAEEEAAEIESGTPITVA